MEYSFEQGPIRPPSEARSLLVRVTRNCPWNRCMFCHLYKGKKFTVRSVSEVKEDIRAIKECCNEIKNFSWKLGLGGSVTKEVIQAIYNTPRFCTEGLLSAAAWLYYGGNRVFLQDANSLIVKTDRLIDIISFLKDRFPAIERITTYGRAKTAARKSQEELKELASAGLSRIHIGLETGYDPLLAYMKKGVTARDHIRGGRKVVESGISLSEYVILGLGGKRMWRNHALHTAATLNEINPDFIRIRTLRVLPSMPLYEKIRNKDFVLLNEEEVLREERLLIENLDGIQSYLVSDHILNLLEEVEGRLPHDKEKMIRVIDSFLDLSDKDKTNFIFGRRAGIYRNLSDLSDVERYNRIQEAIERVEDEGPDALERTIREMTSHFI